MAGQDIKKRIEAGGVTHINVGGDYLFLKFADRQVNVIITGGPSGGSRVTMEAGDKYRPGQFQAFEVENPDPDNPAQIIFTVGTGDYNRQIVQGEISVIPGVRGADGAFIEDTRWDLTGEIDITQLDQVTYTRDQNITQWDPAGQNIITLAYGRNGRFLLYTDFNNDHYQLDTDTGASAAIGTATMTLGAVEVICWNGSLDEKGDLWCAGRMVSDGKACIFKINAALAVSEVIAAPVLPHWSAGNPAKPLFYAGRRLFAMVDNTMNTLILFEEFDGVMVEIKRWQKTIDFAITPSDISIQSGHVVFSDTGVVNPMAAYVIDTWEQVDPTGFINGKYAMTIDSASRTYFVALASPTVYQRALVSWTRKAAGTFETCAGGYAFDPAETITEAEITTEQTDKGVAVTGQVIRALLEMWLGQFVADDYLDHVYKVEFDNANGRAPVTVSSGGTSFAGAKIADSYRCVFPQTVKITLDNNLTTKD